MNIPQYTRNKVTSIVKERLWPYYNLIYGKKNSDDFDAFVKPTFDEIWTEIKQVDEITYTVLCNHLKRSESMKKRWAAKEEKNHEKSLLHQEINSHTKTYKKAVAEDNLDAFIALFGCKSIKELRQKKLDDLKEWRKDNEKPLVSFPYIEGKKPMQIQKAFANDIRFLTMYYMQKHEPKQAIVSIPNILTETYPVDTSNRKKFDGLIHKSGNDEFYFNKILLDENCNFESRLDVDFLSEKFLAKFLKLMNATDYQVLMYVLSLRGESFVTTGEIEVDIGDIVRNCGAFQSQGENNYKAVKASLYKMKYMQSGVVNSSLRGFTFSIFADVRIYGDDNGQGKTRKNETDRATVWVGRSIIDAFIKNQTVQMYRHIIDSFKWNESKVLINALQRQRIVLSAKAKEGEVIKFQANLRFFRNSIVFPNKKIPEQLKLINRTLEEIKNSGITLKNFTQVHDTFHLEFYPFSEEEKSDLLSNQGLELLVQ